MLLDPPIKDWHALLDAAWRCIEHNYRPRDRRRLQKAAHKISTHYFTWWEEQVLTVFERRMQEQEAPPVNPKPKPKKE